MITGMLDDPERDPRLADALRATPTPGSSLGDDQLRSRIMAAARVRVTQLRTPQRPWWEWTAAWARVVVPVGLAASLAAAVLLVQSTTTDESVSRGADTVTVSGVILSAAAGSTGSPQVGDELVAQASDDWLLTQVMSR